MKKKRGFTLTELLVVLGIIVLLIGILLPVLGSLREQGRRVQCASNISQITHAVMAYVVDNEGRFPGPAAGATPQDNDWIFFHTGRDLQRSALARYFGVPMPETVLRCPSDEWDAHQQQDGNGGPYHYSYTINGFLTKRGDGVKLPKVTKLDTVNHPEEKLLVVEESETTINDGMWVPVLDPEFKDIDWLASRHERRRDLTDAEKDATTGRRGRANVSFADGHVDFVPRSYAHDDAHVLMLK